MIIFSLFATGCEKLPDEAMYTIRQGQHYATTRPIIKIESNRIDFTFHIHKSWLHEPQYDVGWSKLMGLSNGLNVHENSGRLAWRCIDGKIHLAAYFYIDGKVSWIEMGEYEVGRTYSGYVDFSNSACHIGAGNETVVLRGYDVKNKSWLCHPYFGGTLPAPHNMVFYFNFL